MKAYAQWAITRVIIPVSWFASSVYVTRLAVDNAHIEFALGALVLIIYAVMLDFPRKERKRAT